MNKNGATIKLEFDYDGDFGSVQNLAQDILKDVEDNYVTDLPITAVRVVGARAN